MAWDFQTDPEFQEKLDWVEQFCKDELEPLHYVFPHAVRSPDPTVKALVRELQQKVRDQGLWAIFLDEELGGPGFGQLKLGLLNEILGRYPPPPRRCSARAAPDTGNMEMLAAYGTDEQKKRWLEPLLAQEMFSAYSMTEPQGGSDPNLFRTHALRDGDEWVITGEKWFTSAGRVADILFVMCTNGMFVVPRDTPGVEIMPEPRNHNHIKYHDVRIPADHLLGPEDGAKVLAQRRLGGGRIHHAMRTIAQCKLAFDMMCERALSRESHGKVIADHQMVQEKIADSYAQIKMLRLYVLETAWKIDQTSTQEARTDIAAVKYTMARVLREVSFNALHIHGSLGTTNLTPLQDMYAGAPTMGLADGADEVHKATVARPRPQGLPPPRGLLPRASSSRPRRKRRGRPSSPASKPIPPCANRPRPTASTWPVGAEPPSERRPAPRQPMGCRAARRGIGVGHRAGAALGVEQADLGDLADRCQQHGLPVELVAAAVPAQAPGRQAGGAQAIEGRRPTGRATRSPRRDRGPGWTSRPPRRAGRSGRARRRPHARTPRSARRW